MMSTSASSVSEVFEHRHVVGPDEIDELRHASNVRYLAWIMDAATAHSEAWGWPSTRYLELGAAWVVRRHELRYVRSALLGDALNVQTWVSDVRKASCLRHYRILRGTEVLLLASTSWAFVDLARGVPTRIPEPLAAQVRAIAREAEPPLVDA